MTNSVAEKVRKHWIWFAMIVVSTAIGVTWKVAHELYVKPRDDEIQRLTRRIADLEKREAIPRALKEEQVIHKASTSSQKPPVMGPVKEGKLFEKAIPYPKTYDKLFEKGNPYPRKYDKVKLGMRLTVMKKVYPSAEYEPGWQTWRVVFPDSPFSFVNYSVDHKADSADPKITSMEYYFTDKDARRHLTDQALLAFGSESVKSEMLGEELEWSDIGGTRVKIDPARYILSEAKDEWHAPKLPP